MKNFAPRTLVLITLALIIAVSGGVVIAAKSHLPPSVEINYLDQPTIGSPKARIHLVIFEEPKCINCAKFTKEIFPKIKKEFIDTHKATFTVIPVSFLSGSMPAATALLCAYNSDPLYPNSELFFDYLDYMYSHQPDENLDWATKDRLVEMAKETSPAINPAQLEKCIDMQSYHVRIQKNLELAKKAMNGKVATPTLFVNGIEVQSLTYKAIKDLIEEVSK